MPRETFKAAVGVVIPGAGTGLRILDGIPAVKQEKQGDGWRSEKYYL